MDSAIDDERQAEGVGWVSESRRWPWMTGWGLAVWTGIRSEWHGQDRQGGDGPRSCMSDGTLVVVPRIEPRDQHVPEQASALPWRAGTPCAEGEARRDGHGNSQQAETGPGEAESCVVGSVYVVVVPMTRWLRMQSTAMRRTAARGGGKTTRGTSAGGGGGVVEARRGMA